jgi:hypothetical protein
VTKSVSINGQTIGRNAKCDETAPPIRIARSPSDAQPVYASKIEIVGTAKLIYDPEKAIMRCGARLALICDDVKVIR